MADWIPTTVAGAIGALVMFWLSGRRYVSQYWWAKQFEIYSQVPPLIMELYERIRALTELLRPSHVPGSSDARMWAACRETVEKLRALHGHGGLVLSDRAALLIVGLVETMDNELPSEKDLRRIGPVAPILVFEQLDKMARATLRSRRSFVAQARRDLGEPMTARARRALRQLRRRENWRLPRLRTWLAGGFSLGLLVPFGFFLAHQCCGYVMSEWSLYVWPTGPLLFLTHGREGSWWAAWVIFQSVAANALLYAATGLVLWLLLKGLLWLTRRLRRPKL